MSSADPRRPALDQQEREGTPDDHDHRPTRPTASRRTLWALQILLGLFFVIASSSPKLLGEPSTVHIVAEIGAGEWFRYFVGFVELAGGIGLLVPRLAGAAALGPVGLMVGAAYTQVTRRP